MNESKQNKVACHQKISTTVAEVNESVVQQNQSHQYNLRKHSSQSIQLGEEQQAIFQGRDNIAGQTVGQQLIRVSNEGNPVFVNVKPHLTKPKQLIPSSILKHVYPQQWDGQYNTHQQNTLHILHNYQSTLNQARSNVTNNGKSTNGIKNRKFEGDNGDIRSRAENGQFGQLVYSRFGVGEKRWNNLWKPTPALTTQVQILKYPDSPVQFDSRFQSGNLLQAFHYKKAQIPIFSLVLQNDTNTYGYNQWFYFKAKTKVPHLNVRFQIVNMRKNYSLHHYGMKIAVFDQLLYRSHHKDWHRGGINIQYTPNNIGQYDGFHTLGWEYTLQSTQNWVYFAYSYPFTYTQLRQQLMGGTIRDAKKKGQVQVKKLGLTLMKNILYMIHIKQSPSNPTKNEQIEQNNNYQLGKILENQNLSAQLKKSNNKKQNNGNNLKYRNQSYQNKQIPLNTQDLGNDQYMGTSIRRQSNKKELIKTLNKSSILEKEGDRQIMTLSPAKKNRTNLKNPKIKIRDAINSLTPIEQSLSKNSQISIVQNVKNGKESRNEDRKKKWQLNNRVSINMFRKDQALNNTTISPNKLDRTCKILNMVKNCQKNKDILLVMARSHPGQSVSSHVLNGFLQQILQAQPESLFLKKTLEIIIIPMLNPDGVIHGNTRTSLSGNDLNRRWDFPSSRSHPQLYLIKKYLNKLLIDGQGERKIFSMVDLHGHTGKQSAFFYGCCDRTNFMKHYDVRLLNQLEGELDPQNFNSKFSNHYVGPGKASTARVAFFRQYQAFSYTLESSFLGAAGNPLHFSVLDYNNIGKRLVRSLAVFRDTLAPKVNLFEQRLSLLHCLNKNNTGMIININTTKIKGIVNDFKQIQKNILKKSRKEAMEMMIKEYETNKMQDDKQSNGSSSCPSNCNYDQKFLEQQIGKEEDEKNGCSLKKMKMDRDIRRRELFLSLQKRQKELNDEEQMRIVTSRRKLSLKSDLIISSKKSPEKQQRMSFDVERKQKLPFLPFSRKVQKQTDNDPSAIQGTPKITNTFFQAFNFKARKGGVYKKKKSSALLMDSLTNE